MESMLWQISISRVIRGMDYHWVAARWFSFSARSAPTNRRDARRPSFAPLRGTQSNRRYIIELNIAWSRSVWDHLTRKRDRLFFQDKRGDTLFKNDLLRQEWFGHKRKDDVGERCLALEFLMIFNEILLSIISVGNSFLFG